MSLPNKSNQICEYTTPNLPTVRRRTVGLINYMGGMSKENSVKFVGNSYE